MLLLNSTYSQPEAEALRVMRGARSPLDFSFSEDGEVFSCPSVIEVSASERLSGAATKVSTDLPQLVQKAEPSAISAPQCLQIINKQLLSDHHEMKFTILRETLNQSIEPTLSEGFPRGQIDGYAFIQHFPSL